jgi:hypothetical protein
MINVGQKLNEKNEKKKFKKRKKGKTSILSSSSSISFCFGSDDGELAEVASAEFAIFA